MGTLDQVLSGVQKTAEAPPPTPASPAMATTPANPDAPGFQDVLGGVKQQATGEPPPITTTEDAVMASMQKKRAAMQDAHQTLLDNSATRILASGGQGIADVGAALIQQKPAISEEEIYKVVPFNGEDGWIKNISKDVVREGIRTYGQAAGVADMVMNAFGGGIPLAATQQMLQQTGKETGTELPGAMAKGLTDPATLAILHQMHGMPVRDIVANPPLPAEMTRAINNGIMEPNVPGMKSEALQVANAQAVSLYGEQSRLAISPTVKKFIPEEQTIHDVVRQENPSLFNEYDNLSVKRDTYTQFFNDLLDKHEQEARENAPHNEEITSLQAKMEDANARKSKIYQEQIDGLTQKNEDYVQEQMNPANFGNDIKNVRGQLAKVSQRIGDMAPDVKEAYASAQGRILPKVESVAPENTATGFERTEGHLGEFKENPELAKDEESRQQITQIAQDVEQKLKASGRPSEEASAQGQVVGSFFNTVSKIYPEKGTAKQIYDKEKPSILTGKTGKIGKKEASLAQGILGGFRSATDKARAIIKIAGNADATTFMHESAHHFFDIIHRYSAEENAPQRLKDDYATMRKWMGIPEGADAYHKTGNKFTFNTQLEKFARGFETYLKEGRAPSRELAGVFAKFKTWITDIYNTLRKSGQPISNDIRGVFDRMLAEKPEKTVIAPDHEPGKMAADIHEADAHMAGIGERSSIGDNIEKEMDATAKLHNPEVADAIKAAETGGVTEPSASNTTDEAATERRPGQGGASEESGTKPASGTEPETTGNGGSGGGTIEKSKSVKDIFDKAGNLIPKNLTNSDEVIAGLKTMAEQTKLLNNDVVSDVQVAETALSMGVKEQELNLRKMRRIFVDNNIPLAAGMRSLTVMMDRVMDDVTQFAKNVQNGTIEDEMKLMEGWKQFKMIGETISGTAHEAGLLLRSFRGSMKDTMDTVSDLDQLFQTEMGMTRDQVKKFANALTDKLNNRERAKLMSDSQKQGFAENFSNVLRFNVISGILTHFKWITGTAVNTLLLKPLVIDAYAGLENRIGMVFGKEDTGARILGGAQGLLYALGKRLPNILSDIGLSIRTGKTLLMPFEDTAGSLMGTGVRKELNVPKEQLEAAVNQAFKPDMFPDLVELQKKIESEKTNIDRKFKLGEEYRNLADEKRNLLTKQLAAEWQARDKTWHELYGEIGNFATSVGAAVKMVGKNMVDYSPKGQPLMERRYSSLHERVPNIYVKGVPVAPIGSLTEGIAKPIAATTHAVIREFAAAIESKQKAVEIAAKRGFKGEDLAQHAAYLIKNPTKEMWGAIAENANEQTFMQHGGKTAEAMIGIRRALDKAGNATMKVPIGSVLMPVAEIPANVFGTTLKKYTPFGLLMDDQRGLAKQWSREGAVGRGKLLLGTGLLSLGWYLAGRGDLTPSRPKSQNQEQLREDSVGPSNSVRIGDWWVDLTHIPVTGKMLTLGADLYHMREVHLGEDESEKFVDASRNTLNGFFVNELSIFELSDVMDAINGRINPAQYLDRKADTVIPQYISQVTQMTDPYKRMQADFMSSLQARIPGESLTLSPKIDAVTGEPVEQHPFGVQKAKDDTIAIELNKIRIAPANPKPVINEVPLNPVQAAEFSSARGHILHSGLQVLMQDDGAEDYNQADTGTKRKMVLRIETHATNCAKSMMFNKYPELLKDANDKYEAQCQEDVQ